MQFSTKQILILAGVLVVILAITGWYYYKKGKKTTTIAPIPQDLPNIKGPNGEILNNPSGLSDADLSQLADDIYADMQGLTIFRNNELYGDWLKLSDTDFVKIYNLFNSRHQADSGATLRDWLYGEVGVWGSDFNALKKEIMSRMGRLNLK